MGKQRRVPYYHHPLFTSVLPGVGGLVAGVVMAAFGSTVAFYYSGPLIADGILTAGFRQLTPMTGINVALPIVLLFVSLVVGRGLGRAYSRSLRRNEELFAKRLLLTPRERRRQLTFRQKFRIEWALWILGDTAVGLMVVGCVVQNGFLGNTPAFGLLAGLGITYPERRRIYDRAFAAANPGAERAGLPLMGKLLAASCVILSVAVLGYMVWLSLRMSQDLDTLHRMHYFSPPSSPPTINRPL